MFRYPRDPQRVNVLENLKKLLQRADDESAGLSAETIRAERIEALRHVETTCFPALTNESEAISTVSSSDFFIVKCAKCVVKCAKSGDFA